MSIFTLAEARKYAAQDDIETWIHLFLNGEGDNVGLSDGLKKRKRFWLGPIEIHTSHLERIVGPELHMEYVEDVTWWDSNINQICKRLEAGWDMPPLIAEIRNESISVRDGNHRLGALQRLNKETCNLILWDDTSVDHILKVLHSCQWNS